MIYFLKCGKYVKIGTAIDVSFRIAELNRMNPYPTKLLYQMSGGRETEIGLHKKFAEYRTKGEWFRLEGLLEDYLVNLGSDINNGIEIPTEVIESHDEELKDGESHGGRTTYFRRNVHIELKVSEWNLLCCLGNGSMQDGAQKAFQSFMEHFSYFSGGRSACFSKEKLEENYMYELIKFSG